MAVCFIDANVILRALTGSEPKQATASQTLLLRVEAGEEKVTTSPLVLFEVIFTLHSKRSYDYLKERVVELITPLLQLRGFQLHQKDLWKAALAIWLEHPIDFTDAYNVAFMRSSRIREIYTWDKGYQHVADITRIEPTASPDKGAA
jgi:predicted nucleic acid-binding protein